MIWEASWLDTALLIHLPPPPKHTPDSANLLRKTYFGGGTVEASVSTERYHVLRKSIPARFEDGTIPFLSIVALGFGLSIFDRTGGGKLGGMGNVTRHTFALTQYLYKRLIGLRHYNGAPVVVVYGKHEHADPALQVSLAALGRGGDRESIPDGQTC